MILLNPQIRSHLQEFQENDQDGEHDDSDHEDHQHETLFGDENVGVTKGASDSLDSCNKTVPKSQSLENELSSNGQSNKEPWKQHCTYAFLMIMGYLIGTYQNNISIFHSENVEHYHHYGIIWDYPSPFYFMLLEYEKFKSSLQQIITIIGVIYIAYIIVIVGVTTITFLTLYKGSIQIYKVYRNKSYSRKDKAHFDQCQQRIQTALGSIHAPQSLLPPLQTNVEESKPCLLWDSDKSIRSDLTELIETNARLYHVYDMAIHYIRMASSIHLGLGSQSRVVTRVEDAMIVRDNTKLINTNHTNEGRVDNTKATECEHEESLITIPFLAVQRSREVVFESMRSQIGSLCTILELLLRQHEKQNISKENDDHNNASTASNDDHNRCMTNQIIEDYQQLQHFQPAQITLSLLQIYRRYLGELLSDIISYFTSMNYPLDNGLNEEQTDTVEKKLMNTIRQNISHSFERYTYLKSYFPHHHQDPCHYSESSQNSAHGNNVSSQEKGKKRTEEENRVDKNTTPFDPLIPQLRSHIEALVVTLWAYEQSVLEHNISTKEHKNEKEVDKYHPSYSWWLSFSNALQNVLDTFGEIDTRLFQEDDETISKDNDDSVRSSTMVDRHTSEKDEYNDIGSEFRTSTNQMELEDPNRKNRTVIFNGQGNKSSSSSRRQRNGMTKRTTKDEKNSLQDRVLPLESAAIQSILLRELQKRLQTIELAEEWDATQLEEEEEEEESNKGIPNSSSLSGRSRSSKNSEKSSPFFQGASGSLLLELQSAISLLPTSTTSTGAAAVDDSDTHEE